MEIGILGPLEVHVGGAEVDLGTRKARVVLAALVLGRARLVSADHLIEAAWPADLPANPRAALQTNVARVRRALVAAEVSGARLETRPDGYRLRLEPDEVDAERFEVMTARAQQQLAWGDAGGAASELRAALRLWRGPVLGDLGDLPFAATERARLDELRLIATEDRIEAELLLGRHRDLVPELEALVATHPGHEELCVRLALALYRTGRQTDALDRIRQLELHLGDELGLRPSTKVRELERQLLVHDPELDAGPWECQPDGSAPPPRNGTGTAGSIRSQSGRSTSRNAGARELPPLPGIVEHHRVTAMVGRAEVLERLGRLVAADGGSSSAGLPSGTATRLAVITGEPGIGKTRVVAEACANAHAAGAVALFGRCDPEPLLPAQPLVEILDQVIAAAEMGLVGALGPRASELARLLPDIGDRLPHVGSPTDAPGEAATYLLACALGDALRAIAANGPLALVIDDIHWADQVTLDVVRHLATSGDLPRTTLMVTCRPDPGSRIDALLAALSRASLVTEMALDGLSEDETSALVASALVERRLGPPSSGLGRSIHEKTGGNPFFTLELSRHVLEAEGSDRAAADDLPRGVVAVVQHRIEELGATAAEALRVAALLGAEFDVDVALGACVDPAAARGLQAAEAAGVIRKLPGPPSRYAFAHAIVHSVLTRSLGAGDREALHARVAMSIEANRADPVPHAALAHHWARAGLAHLDRTVEHSLLAAEASLARCAYEDAADRCDVGLGALDAAEVQDHRRLRLLLTAAAAHDAGAEHHRARARAGAAFTLARELGDVDAVARAATIALPVIPDPAAAAMLEEAVAVVPPGHGGRALLLASLGCMLPETEVDRAETLIAEARALGTAAQDIHVMHRVLSFDTFTGQDVTPEERIRAATELLQLLPGDRSSLAVDAHTIRGAAHLERGDRMAAELDFDVHARMAAERRTPGALAVDDQRRAMRAMLVGRFDDAERHVHQAMLHVSDDPAWLSVYGAQLVAIRIESGRHHEALDLLNALQPPDADRPLARTTRAMVLAAVGRDAEAASLVTELCAELPGWRRDHLWPITTTTLAEAVVGVGDRQAASTIYRSLSPIADRLVVFTLGAICWGSVHRFLARLALLLANVDDAVAHHEQAMVAHERLGAPLLLGQDRLGLAEALRQRGRSGDEARAAALTGSSDQVDLVG